MTDQKYIIGSLAMDLKRVALSYHNGSIKTAGRFSAEALKRSEEIEKENLKDYFENFLNRLPTILNQKDTKKIAEDALMYSTIFQNYALRNV